MSCKVLSHKTIYSDEKFYSAFPSACQLDNGDILIAFRLARDSRYLLATCELSKGQQKHLLNQVDHVDSRSHIVFLKFDNKLNPLTEIKCFPPDPQVADQDASLIKLKNGNLVLASFSWYPVPPQISKKIKPNAGYVHGSTKTTGNSYLLWGGFTSTGDKNAQNWSQRRYIEGTKEMPDVLSGVRGPNGGPPRGALAEDGKGNLYMATYGGEKGAKNSQCFLWKSNDQGNNWQFQNIIATDAKIGFQEPSLIIDQNHNLICFMRTAGAEDEIATAVSTNLGETWQSWQLHQAQGHPSHPILLNDGRIFLTYGYRHKKYGVRARLIDNRACDIKQAFIQSKEIIIRDDAASADVGYPWGVKLNDGRVLVTYYFTGENGIREISASILKVENE